MTDEFYEKLINDNDFKNWIGNTIFYGSDKKENNIVKDSLNSLYDIKNIDEVILDDIICMYQIYEEQMILASIDDMTDEEWARFNKTREDFFDFSDE